MTMRSEQEGVISDAEYLVGLTLYSPDAQIIPAAMSHVMVTLPLALTMQECIATLRTQLAAANIERAEWENAAGVYEAGMVRAERERDEARRERDALKAMAGVAEAGDGILAVATEMRRLHERAASAEHRAETAERQIKAGVVSYRPTDGETRAAYGRIHALETELTTLRHRAERLRQQLDAVRSLCDDMQDYTALKVLELLDDASGGEA